MPFWFFDLIAGCRHRSLTRVFTDPKTRASRRVCVDCGKIFPYDWKSMRLGKAQPELAEPIQQEQTTKLCPR